MPTLTERTQKRMPTLRQVAAAGEIMERMNGKAIRDAREQALAPFVPDGMTTVIERLDRAQLTEERLFGTIANGLDANRRDKADHDIRLKSSKLALELRGLLQRGNRGMTFAPSGNCQVNVGLPWQSPTSNDSDTNQPNEQSIVPSTVRSTIEGTEIGRGAHGHSRSTMKSRRTVPVERMSLLQLKNVPADVRADELLRRLLLREKKNKRHRKHVGPNHTSKAGTGRAGTCRSGKCGKCRECKRRAKLRLPDAK